jgi:serine/threonine-protein kinase RsbW
MARRFVAGLLGDGCPIVADVVLVTSELASNAVMHSDTRRPGGKFTVRAEVLPQQYVLIRVEDEGGPWAPRAPDDERAHGLGIVSTVADAWGREGNSATGWVVWARLGWSGT